MIDHSEEPERQVPAASGRVARRHRVEGGRQRVVKFRFTDAEYEAIGARAAEAGVSVPRLVIASALTRRPATPAAPSALAAELAGLRRLVANLANNINQIARKLNAGGWPDASIAPAADAVQRTMRRLDAALAAVGATTQTMPAGRPAQGPDPPDRPAEPEPEQAGTFRNVLPPQRNAPWMPG
jgi:small-conductance mechanosensitive channel